MTSIAEIISEAMIYIDDVRLQEQLSSNPALFYRRMSAYVSAAMPLLNSPPELYQHIANKLSMPTFESTGWVSTDESTTQDINTIDTGMVGYDLCSVVIRTEEGMSSEPYTGYEYNSETGIVTFPVQSAAGIEYELDFYKDGEVSDLTLTMKRLFGLAIAIVWDERLDHAWLAITPKIKDSSFQTVNESNYMDKLAVRKVTNRQAFQDELRKYEQNNAYLNVRRPKSEWSLM